MAFLSSIKPFLPILLTFLIPRAIGLYRSLKIAIKTRPPPSPLPANPSRALNILGAAICIFLLMSLPGLFFSAPANIFQITKSRFHIPTDVLFSRLAQVRPLNAVDEGLRKEITTPTSRALYLRFGPETLAACPFCDATDIMPYLLYHLPTNILLPHLIHLLAVGLATSAAIAGELTQTLFRKTATFLALALICLDIYLTMRFPIPIPHQHSPTPPKGIYWTALTIRPLTICIFDGLLAASIYLASTNRLPFLFSTSRSWSETEHSETQKRRLHNLVSSSVALQTSLAKLKACTLARRVVVRDGDGLKRREDDYWSAVAEMDGEMVAKQRSGDELQWEQTDRIWHEEEVVDAVARATTASGTDQGPQLDIERIRREARIWVDNVTGGSPEPFQHRR